MPAEPTDRRHRNLRWLVVALVGALGVAALPGSSHAAAPARLVTETPEPTDPPPESAPAESTASEGSGLDAEAPEPDSVPTGVWIAAILVLVVAVVWATRQTTRDPTSEIGDS